MEKSDNEDEDYIQLEVRPGNAENNGYLFLGQVVVDKALYKLVSMVVLKKTREAFGEVINTLGHNKLLIAFENVNVSKSILNEGPWLALGHVIVMEEWLVIVN